MQHGFNAYASAARANQQVDSPRELEASLLIKAAVRLQAICDDWSLADRGLDEALNYTKERILFDRPVAATQSAQIKMADMARRITLAQMLVLQLGRLKDAGNMQPSQVSLAKWNNCRMAIDIARECRDLLGGAGITTEHAAIRHALNLESVITYEGTETVHQLVIGRELTGINAF